jgi:ABC-type nitrate/sulfonate/bicarbonate transport system substrate-binding protein
VFATPSTWRLLAASAAHPTQIGTQGRELRIIGDLRGKKIILRETEGIRYAIIGEELRKAGLEPQSNVEWVLDRIFAYHDNPAHVEAMRDGKVNCTASNPPFSSDLQKMGCTLLLSTEKLFLRGRPERVIAATTLFAKQNRDYLKRFMKTILRAF